MSKYVAILKDSWQCGPDEWATSLEALDCNDATTLGEIAEWVQSLGRSGMGIELQIRVLQGGKTTKDAL